jgi:hypothetical protein
MSLMKFSIGQGGKKSKMFRFGFVCHWRRDSMDYDEFSGSVFCEDIYRATELLYEKYGKPSFIGPSFDIFPGELCDDSQTERIEQDHVICVRDGLCTYNGK